jgi:N-acetylglucosaminyl-diphospho-decaprenol L-rhamnosyltransferase
LKISKRNSVLYGDNGWWLVTRAAQVQQQSSLTTQQSLPTTSVIVVMFNSESTLDACLSSIPSTSEVVLVDNASTDASASMAVQIRPDAKLIRAGANRGFPAGNNLGAANATGEVLIFLNPDASFDRDGVRILADTVVNKGAMVGPRILDSAGNEATRARYWSRVWSDLAEIFFPTRLVKSRLPRSIGRDMPPDQEVYRSGGQVPYVQGCCIALSAEHFWRIGGWDERMFLYHEEEALARSLEMVGVPVILEPRAIVSHIGGVSSSQYPDFSAHQYFRSKALVYRGHYSTPVTLVAGIAFWSVLQAMAVLTPIRKLIGLRADRERSWYRAAATGVISGIRTTGYRTGRRIVMPPRVH